MTLLNLAIKLNNTLQDPFIKDNVEELNKLKHKIVDIDKISDNLPESEVISTIN